MDNQFCLEIMPPGITIHTWDTWWTIRNNMLIVISGHQVTERKDHSWWCIKGVNCTESGSDFLRLIFSIYKVFTTVYFGMCRILYTCTVPSLWSQRFMSTVYSHKIFTLRYNQRFIIMLTDSKHFEETQTIMLSTEDFSQYKSG